MESLKIKPESFCSNILEYLFIIWDGSEFFTFDDTKLNRLNGKKTSFLDKFKNKKWVLQSALSLAIVIYIVLDYASMIDDQKSQTIGLQDNPNY